MLSPEIRKSANERTNKQSFFFLFLLSRLYTKNCVYKGSSWANVCSQLFGFVSVESFFKRFIYLLSHCLKWSNISQFY